MGDWHCVGGNDACSSWMDSGSKYQFLIHDSDLRKPGYVLRAVDRGDLLPILDPENDPATWACALRDLALAEAPWPGFSAKTATLHWYRMDPTAWRFEAHLDDKHIGRIWDIVIDDPAIALAMARAQLRETGWP